MDKNKIKNIALGVSLGINIILGFFLGGGLISSCTAKKPVDATISASADASGEFIDPPQKHALAPRYAASDEIDPSEYDNLWVESGTRYNHWTGGYLYPNSNNGVSYTLNAQGHIRFNLFPSAGLYYVESSALTCVINANTYNQILNNAYDFTIYPTFYKPGVKAYYVYVSASDIANNYRLAVSSYASIPNVYLIDGEYLPASDRVTFPRNFFPWQIWGNRATDVLIGGPAVTSSTDAETQSVTFGNLLFRCNGRIYRGITLLFTFRPGQRLGKYDPAGEIYANGLVVYSSSNPAWFLSGMLYIPAETGTSFDRVLTANYAQSGDNTLLMPNPVWSKEVYRTIDILDASEATITGVPSGVGTNTAMEWLNIIAAAESVSSTSGAGDPFTMLGNGFTAVANILSIPILPFMTLGTLIAVPLIVLVILAILRLLAK